MRPNGSSPGWKNFTHGGEDEESGFESLVIVIPAGFNRLVVRGLEADAP